MEKLSSENDNLVFGLDIGTRSIVGVVGYQDHSGFRIVAMAEKEHETRAMLDGQIHDIYQVGDTIRSVKNDLEGQLHHTLNDVCIAAAGRVLKCITANAEYEFEEETKVTQEQIYALNLIAVEKAHGQINIPSNDTRFFCVGNTPVRYQLNGFDISNLEGHKANKIGVELIATFLPQEVVDSLYEAMEYAGLRVESLTLEPIAAMNIAIPQQYRLLNIGLIDVGAGTSDICLTKDGSIIAYGMIPIAGDEITEVIAKHFLVDFNCAEQIKRAATREEEQDITFLDIMGLPQTTTVDEVAQLTHDVIEKMAKSAADKIIELNGGKPVNAVFVVGGGGKMTGYTQLVADCLGIARERVALRGKEVLNNVSFDEVDFEKDSLYVTPVGICTNYYIQKSNFIFVTVNQERVKLFDNNRLTVAEAVMQIGFLNEKLFPRRGAELVFTVNGKTRLVRGSSGEGAVIELNGKNANLNTSIEQNDVITVIESGIGQPAHRTIGQLEEYKATISFMVNRKLIICPKFAYVNGELQSSYYEIKSGDDIRMENYYTVSQLFTFLDFDLTGFDVLVNHGLATADTKVYENFTVETKIADSLSAVSSEIAGETENAEETTNSEQTANSEDASSKMSALETTQPLEATPPLVSDKIVIYVNQQPVTLSGKSSYVLVDLFDFYEFDLSKPRGTIVLKLNGQTCEYVAPIQDGDVVDLYWE